MLLLAFSLPALWLDRGALNRPAAVLSTGFVCVLAAVGVYWWKPAPAPACSANRED